MGNFSASASVVVAAPAGRVWAALTEPDLVKKYFFGTDLVTDWSVGSAVKFRGEWQGKTYEDKGTVLEFEPRRSLSFDYWSSMSGAPDAPENYQTLRYHLEEVPEGTRVTITQSGAPTQEAADHSAKNWDMVLQGMKALVEKGN